MAETADARPHYERALIKLSGEAFMGRFDYGIDPDMVMIIADELVKHPERNS